jgi:hypothetical protein
MCEQYNPTDTFETEMNIHKSQSHFIRACHEKIDVLRILQFLKERQLPDKKVGEAALTRLLEMYKNQFRN